MTTQLGSLFIFLMTEGVDGRTASAELVLGNGNIMTVRAGGPGIHSEPSCSPFMDYEVLLDHETERFWTRYAADGLGSLYAHVPWVLLAHHIIRRGGIVQMAVETYQRSELWYLKHEILV